MDFTNLSGSNPCGVTWKDIAEIDAHDDTVWDAAIVMNCSPRTASVEIQKARAAIRADEAEVVATNLGARKRVPSATALDSWYPMLMESMRRSGCAGIGRYELSAAC